MMKGLRTFLYELKYAFLQMKRHIMLCFSAISAIGITLLLIGSILIIGLHVNYFSNDVQKDLRILMMKLLYQVFRVKYLN